MFEFVKAIRFWETGRMLLYGKIYCLRAAYSEALTEHERNECNGNHLIYGNRVVPNSASALIRGALCEQASDCLPSGTVPPGQTAD